MGLTWGQPNRRVCWLAAPSAIDMYLPEDHTLEWVFCEPVSFGGKPPRPFFSTIDQNEASLQARWFYCTGRSFVLVTHWRDPEGLVVKKMPIVKRWKERHLAGFDLFEEQS